MCIYYISTQILNRVTKLQVQWKLLLPLLMPKNGGQAETVDYGVFLNNFQLQYSGKLVLPFVWVCLLETLLNMRCVRRSLHTYQLQEAVLRVVVMTLELAKQCSMLCMLTDDNLRLCFLSSTRIKMGPLAGAYRTRRTLSFSLHSEP